MTVQGMSRWTLWVALVLLVACGDEQQPEEATGRAYAPDVAVDPGEPDSFPHILNRAMNEERPQELWQALPASYRSDVESVIQEFAQQMDAEIYDQAFVVLGKFARVLDEKREYLVQASGQAGMMMPGFDPNQSWDTMSGVLGSLTKSEIATLDGLKSLDVEAFLSGTGGQLISQASSFSESMLGDEYQAGLEDSRNMRTSVISSTDEVALVRITTPRETVEQAMIRVEGAWIPQEIADEWSTGMTEARAALKELDVSSMKTSFLPLLKQLDGSMDQLLASADEAEFREGMASLQQQIMMALMGGAMADAMSSMGAPGGGETIEAPDGP